MKIVTQRMIMLMVASVALLTNAQAKIIEVAEDGYMMPAPQQIRDVAEKAAALIDFDTGYEIVAPKKSAMTINPWTKFAAYAINPATKNPLLIINTEWFLKMPEDQQLFLLSRNLLILSNKVSSFPIKLIPYLFMLLSLCFVVFVFFALRQTPLKDKKLWIRILVAFGIGLVGEVALLNRLEANISHYVKMQYDKKINELVIQKTNDRDAAIKAFEFIDSSLKNELGNGEMFWAPYEKLFEEYAQNLKA